MGAYRPGPSARVLWYGASASRPNTFPNDRRLCRLQPVLIPTHPNCKPSSSQYVGLWHEAEGDKAEAEKAVTAAVATPYARLSGDYMASLARVHCLRRGWQVPGAGKA